MPLSTNVNTNETRKFALDLQNNTCVRTLSSASDGPANDAFGRLRVSMPETLFDSKNIFNDPDLAETLENQPLFYDNQQTAGGGTSTTYNVDESSQSLLVGNTTAGTRIRQTKQRFNYQPGKSQMVLMTINFCSLDTGITKREGIFDASNGLFLQSIADEISFVRRTFVTGSAADNKVLQANWNLDTMDGNGLSGITLDFTKTQILIIDYEWLGVGRVRMGFVIDGKIYYAHEFLNANNLDVVYMSTPNLPLRSEITNGGTGPASELVQICSSVISEGGSQDLGSVRFVSTGGTHVDANTENTEYAVIGIKLKDGYLGTTVKLIEAGLQIHTASEKVLWRLKLNPTVAGTAGDAFTYTGLPQSAISFAIGKTANTITNGYDIAGGFVESGGVSVGSGGSDKGALNNAIRLGSTIAGVSDTIVLTATPIGGSSDVDIEGSLTFRELV